MVRVSRRMRVAKRTKVHVRCSLYTYTSSVRHVPTSRSAVAPDLWQHSFGASSWSGLAQRKPQPRLRVSAACRKLNFCTVRNSVVLVAHMKSAVDVFGDAAETKSQP